jgi:phage terminase large subunit
MGLNGILGVKKYAGYKEDIAMRLQGYQIYILEDSTDAIKEFSTYSWARDKNGKQLPKLQDGDDHLIDCLIMKIAMHTGEYSILDVV